MTPLPGTVNFPHIAQIFRIERDREMCKSGKKSTEIAYGITSVPKDRGTPENLLAWNRGHWSVENRNHRARDVNFREDACVGHTTHGPSNGAICNNIALAIILSRGHRGRELAYASPPAQIPACALTHGAPASDDDEAQLARLRVLKPIAVTRETPTQSRLRKCVLHRLVGSAEWSFPPNRGDLQTRRHERRVSLLGQRHSILGHPSGFLFAAFVSSQPHVTRFPASECGTCFGLPDSPRLWPLAPSAPQGVTACCSQVSQLLWPHLTSLNFTSLASSFLCFPLRPRTTAWRLRDLSGPDEVLLRVPWFLDPGMPSFA